VHINAIVGQECYCFSVVGLLLMKVAVVYFRGVPNDQGCLKAYAVQLSQVMQLKEVSATIKVLPGRGHVGAPLYLCVMYNHLCGRNQGGIRQHSYEAQQGFTSTQVLPHK